jgi:hypothetical protein
VQLNYLRHDIGLNWNGDLDTPNGSEDNYKGDIESDKGPDNSNEDPGGTKQRNLSVAPNVPGLVRPTLWSRRQAKIILVMVNVVQMKRNKRFKKM